jgi:hypothetical protein
MRIYGGNAQKCMSRDYAQPPEAAALVSRTADRIDRRYGLRAVDDELAQGILFAGSGFETRHRLPMRVVKEAIVNAVIHRDYRLNRPGVVRGRKNRIYTKARMAAGRDCLFSADSENKDVSGNQDHQVKRVRCGAIFTMRRHAHAGAAREVGVHGSSDSRNASSSALKAWVSP